MGWYYCSGCGPSVRCDECGATECGQGVHRNAREGTCDGCAKAVKLLDSPTPWNMRTIPRGVRGPKHLRKRETRIRIHQRKFWRGQTRVSWDDLNESFKDLTI